MIKASLFFDIARRKGSTSKSGSEKLDYENWFNPI